MEMVELLKRKRKTGTVISNKMEKTVVVLVNTIEKHPIFKKYIKKSKKYYADDRNNECSVGDVVEIEECRPLSKLKRWRVKRILKKTQLKEEKNGGVAV